MFHLPDGTVQYNGEASTKKGAHGKTHTLYQASFLGHLHSVCLKSIADWLGDVSKIYFLCTYRKHHHHSARSINTVNGYRNSSTFPLGTHLLSEPLTTSQAKVMRMPKTKGFFANINDQEIENLAKEKEMDGDAEIMQSEHVPCEKSPDVVISSPSVEEEVFPNESGSILEQTHVSFSEATKFILVDEANNGHETVVTLNNLS